MAIRLLARLGLTLAFVVAAALPARAGVMAVPGGYEVSYAMNLAGTLNGNPVTSLFILETDGTNVSIERGFTAAAAGPTTLSHTIGFLPTSALVIGLDLAAPGVSDGKTHLVILMDRAFQAAHAGNLFSGYFPAVNGEPRLTHSALVNAITAADGGDPTALEVVRHFFLLGAGSFATFDPAGGFAVVEFSLGTVIDAPEPASLVLLLGGLAGLLVSVRRRVA